MLQKYIWFQFSLADTYEHTFGTTLTPVLGNNDLTVTISNVNGAPMMMLQMILK